MQPKTLMMNWSLDNVSYTFYNYFKTSLLTVLYSIRYSTNLDTLAGHVLVYRGVG
ncbi:hypothetical protein HanRHA438_Chr09g0380081 [Helianthus annuus]|nr:hypothetical protein HanRHA438_Chr09g0380081 [Helianthus annuus]